MGLFSGYNRWRRTQQALRARGRATPTVEEAGAAIAPQIAGEAAEEQAQGREMGYETREKELGTRAGRFAETIDLAKKRLAFFKQRAGAAASIGQERLGLARREIRKTKELAPYALGLGVAGVGVSAWEADKQRKRDEQFRLILGDLLKRGRRRPYDYGGTIPGRGDILGVE